MYNVIIVIDVLYYRGALYSHLLEGGPTFYKGARPPGPPGGYAPAPFSNKLESKFVYKNSSSR